MAQIKIDGETFIVTEGETPTEELLAKAGVEPTKFDLVWIGLSPGATITYSHDGLVEVCDGDDFVTTRTGAHAA